MKSIKIIAIMISIVVTLAVQIADAQMIVRNSQGTASQKSVWTGSQILFTQAPDAGPNFRAITVGDFYGDGNKDIVWQNMTQGTFGDVRIWNNFQASSEVYWRQVKQVWDVQVVGDLDGDGYDDIVWRYMVPGSPDTGVSFIWFTNGSSVTQPRKRGGAPLTWALIGAKDINGDRAADMVYISPENQIRVLMATPNRTCANFGAGNIASGFTAIKFADFSGNRRGEILTRNQSTGEVQLIGLQADGLALPAYNGTPDDQFASCTATSTIIPQMVTSIGVADPSWTFYASVDLNNDGIEDIVWLHPNGNFIVWMMSIGGTKVQIVNAGTAPVGYTAVHPFGKPSVQVIPKKLFMGTASVADNNGVAVSIIDTLSGVVTDLTQFNNKIAFVDGFCYNPVTGDMHLNARANFSGVPDPNGNIRFPLYNLVTGTVKDGPSLGSSTFASVRSPVACLPNGTVYYGLGYIIGNGSSNGRLDVVKNGVRTATINLDQAGNRVPSRMVTEGSELYVMNLAPSGQASSFSVVNTTSESLVRTCQIGSDAIDMDVRNGVAYVSVWRDATSGGKDVLIFNTANCSQVGSMTMTNPGTTRRTYAYGLRATPYGLYIATLEGVRLYSLTTLSQIAFFANPIGTFSAIELAVGSKEVFATFEGGRLVTLTPDLQTQVRTIQINTGTGRIDSTN